MSARTPFVFTGLLSETVETIPLTVDDSDAEVGSGPFSDSGGAISCTGDFGGLQVTTLSGAPDRLVWDTGLTVDDIKGKPIGMRIRDLTVPAGTGMGVVLFWGIAFASAASFTPATTAACTNWFHLGRLTDDNSTCRVGATGDNGSINAGTDIGVLDFADLLFTVRFDLRRNTWLLYSTDTDGDTDERIAQQSSTLTGSHKVLCFIALARSLTIVTEPTLSFVPEFIPPGADWSAPE